MTSLLSSHTNSPVRVSGLNRLTRVMAAVVLMTAGQTHAQATQEAKPGTEPERFVVAEYETGMLDNFYNRFPKTLAEINDELRINITKYGVSRHYYDTPVLSLQQQDALLYFQKDDIKTYDQSINNVFLAMPAAEPEKFATKKYNRKISDEDKHPLLGLIKRSERALFKTRLQETGIENPLQLKKTITVHRQGRVINLFYKGYQLNLVIHDRINTRFLGQDHVKHYLSIPQVKSSEIDDNEDIQLLLSIRDILVRTIQQNFTSLTPAGNFMKINPYRTIGAEIPMMPYIIENTLAYKAFQAVLFLLLLGLVALLLGKLPIAGHKVRKQTVYTSRPSNH